MVRDKQTIGEEVCVFMEKKEKSLREMVEFLDKKARKETLKTFGEEGYKKYCELTNLLDAQQEESLDFTLVASEINAYLG